MSAQSLTKIIFTLKPQNNVDTCVCGTYARECCISITRKKHSNKQLPLVIQSISSCFLTFSSTELVRILVLESSQGDVLQDFCLQPTVVLESAITSQMQYLQERNQTIINNSEDIRTLVHSYSLFSVHQEVSSFYHHMVLQALQANT